jgi:3-oxoadipate CoA-transferase alpha subunit
VNQIVELGQLDPEAVVTPGIFVERLVEVGGRLPPATEGQ